MGLSLFELKYEHGNWEDMQESTSRCSFTRLAAPRVNFFRKKPVYFAMKVGEKDK